MDIPVLDLNGAIDPGGPRSIEFAQQLYNAAAGSGFFYVCNHRVDSRQIDRQFELARQLIEDVPLATRERLAMHFSSSMRGYELLGAQSLDPGARPDIKESFECGMAYPDDHPYVLNGYITYGGNQWPDEVPLAAALCEAYIQSMLGLSRRLMQLLALSLGLSERYFDVSFTNPMVTLRMIRYPPHPADADERAFGAGAHTDWGALTILAQDMHGGLEVCMPDGSWVEATPKEGCLVVNLGDMITRWTNGLYRSNPHRVRNRFSLGLSRYSIPFFYEPDYLARIEPIPGTIIPGDKVRFTPCTAGEHLEEMYSKTYNRERVVRNEIISVY